MTLETRVTTIEIQLQQLAVSVVNLANANLAQSERIASLIDLTNTNARAIADIHAAIDRLTQAIDARLTDLDQKLEQYTDGLMGMIDRSYQSIKADIENEIGGLRLEIQPMHADITGLRLEIQRLIERLNP